MISRALKFLKLDILALPLRPIGGWYLRASSHMITCREFNDFIYAYVDGTLSKKQTILFKRHMAICPMCRNFLKTYIAVYKARGEALPYSDIDVPDEVPQDLIEAIIEVQRLKHG